MSTQFVMASIVISSTQQSLAESISACSVHIRKLVPGTTGTGNTRLVLNGALPDGALCICTKRISAIQKSMNNQAHDAGDNIDVGEDSLVIGSS